MFTYTLVILPMDCCIDSYILNCTCLTYHELSGSEVFCNVCPLTRRRTVITGTSLAGYLSDKL